MMVFLITKPWFIKKEIITGAMSFSEFSGSISLDITAKLLDIVTLLRYSLSYIMNLYICFNYGHFVFAYT
jgi:hypothetical protein